jgi:hypothetical protein
MLEPACAGLSRSACFKKPAVLLFIHQRDAAPLQPWSGGLAAAPRQGLSFDRPLSQMIYGTVDGML